MASKRVGERVRRSGSAVALGLLLSIVVLAGPAAADDPLFLNWSEQLPGMTHGYDANSANECTSGRIQCVDAVVREMTKRFDRLAAACDHDTMFALAYLRTTEEYKRSATTAGFYSDVDFINHEDAVFASYYFEAYDAWHRGDVANVPPAWRLALQAADQKSVNGSTNITLGISAHINRDLPFVLWEIGLVKPDGSSRKPDHDKVNEFLNKVVLFPEANRRFDDTINPDSAPGLIHSIIGMRENAWRNAERLRAAENDPVAFAMVKESIEQSAFDAGVAIKASGLYGPLSNSSTRDAYCMAHHNDV
ncbi:MAG TPA: DUF5995 family protein [Acidimicrobiales bacterium]|nr:DUF5995 family protein [Acidimicrobiales bacterium]